MFFLFDLMPVNNHFLSILSETNRHWKYKWHKCNNLSGISTFNGLGQIIFLREFHELTDF